MKLVLQLQGALKLNDVVPRHVKRPSVGASILAWHDNSQLILCLEALFCLLYYSISSCIQLGNRPCPGDEPIVLLNSEPNPMSHMRIRLPTPDGLRKLSFSDTVFPNSKIKSYSVPAPVLSLSSLWSVATGIHRAFDCSETSSSKEHRAGRESKATDPVFVAWWLLDRVSSYCLACVGSIYLRRYSICSSRFAKSF